jgi:hypothetical protein
VVNIFVAVAGFEATAKRGGVASYFAKPTEVSDLVYIAFGMAAFQSLLHALWLFRVRTFLSVRQMRAVCLAKFVFNCVLPFCWFPEQTRQWLVHPIIGTVIRLGVIQAYLFGYLWAGKAEGVGRILSSEKDV